MSEWIRHDGSGCPLPIGTLFSFVSQHPITGLEHPEKTSTVKGGESWFWRGRPPQIIDGLWINKIIRYRLHDNGEQAKREARIEMLRKMAQPNDYDVRPVKTPEREKA